ncbi:MAG: c-type cytochrome [Burkholderiales bacterium]|nr:c-type cytochrome [Burkholderiales bacterium]
MRTSALLVAVLAGLPAIAAAQGSNPSLGRDLAAGCAHCHGTDGISAGVTESLAGRRAEQIVQTVKEFREGKKPATIMHQISKGYTDAQIAAIAAYFAAQKPAK